MFSSIAYTDVKRVTASEEQVRELTTWLGTTMEETELGLKDLDSLDGSEDEASQESKGSNTENEHFEAIFPVDKGICQSRRATVDMAQLQRKAKSYSRRATVGDAHIAQLELITQYQAYGL